jgi:hypothetical protein
MNFHSSNLDIYQTINIRNKKYIFSLFLINVESTGLNLPELPKRNFDLVKRFQFEKIHIFYNTGDPDLKYKQKHWMIPNEFYGYELKSGTIFQTKLDEKTEEHKDAIGAILTNLMSYVVSLFRRGIKIRFSTNISLPQNIFHEVEDIEIESFKSKVYKKIEFVDFERGSYDIVKKYHSKNPHYFIIGEYQIIKKGINFLKGKIKIVICITKFIKLLKKVKLNKLIKKFKSAAKRIMIRKRALFQLNIILNEQTRELLYVKRNRFLTLVKEYKFNKKLFKLEFEDDRPPEASWKEVNYAPNLDFKTKVMGSKIRSIIQYSSSSGPNINGYSIELLSGTVLWCRERNFKFSGEMIKFPENLIDGMDHFEFVELKEYIDKYGAIFKNVYSTLRNAVKLGLNEFKYNIHYIYCNRSFILFHKEENNFYEICLHNLRTKFKYDLVKYYETELPFFVKRTRHSIRCRGKLWKQILKGYQEKILTKLDKSNLHQQPIDMIKMCFWVKIYNLRDKRNKFRNHENFDDVTFTYLNPVWSYVKLKEFNGMLELDLQFNKRNIVLDYSLVNRKSHVCS